MSAQKTKPPIRAPKISEEELIEAVQIACERSQIPVAPASTVADLESVSIEKESVKRRLDEIDRVNSFDTGGAFVYWVPEEGDPRGKIDPSAIYWDGVELEDIPSEIIDEHPELRDPTRAERLEENGGAIIGPATLSFILGMSILFAYEYGDGIVEPGSNLELIGVFALAGGFTFIFVGFAAILFGKVGQRIEDHPTTMQLKYRASALGRAVENRLPVSWDRLDD